MPTLGALSPASVAAVQITHASRPNWSATVDAVDITLAGWHTRPSTHIAVHVDAAKEIWARSRSAEHQDSMFQVVLRATGTVSRCTTLSTGRPISSLCASTTDDVHTAANKPPTRIDA